MVSFDSPNGTKYALGVTEWSGRELALRLDSLTRLEQREEGEPNHSWMW